MDAQASSSSSSSPATTRMTVTAASSSPATSGARLTKSSSSAAQPHHLSGSAAGAAGEGNIVRINVGGSIFTTRRSTLCAVPGSFLDVLAGGRFRLETDGEGNMFVDRSPEYFAQILDFLRDRGAPRTQPVDARFLHELEYYGIRDQYLAAVERPQGRGVVVAVGGKNGGGEILSSVEVFDPVSGCWCEGPAIPCPLVFAACVADQERMFVTGGFSAKALVSELWSFDLQTRRWTACAPMRQRRYSHRMALLGRQLIVVGGMNTVGSELVRLNHVESYSLDQDRWTDLAPMMQRRFEFAMEVFGGRLWVCGGRDQLHSLSSTEIFDPATALWSVGPDIPHATTNVSLLVADEALHLVCTTVHTALYRWNGAGWTLLPGPPVDIPCPSAHFLNGSIYVFDSFDESNFYHPTYLRFHLAEARWSVHHASFKVSTDHHHLGTRL